MKRVYKRCEHKSFARRTAGLLVLLLLLTLTTAGCSKNGPGLFDSLEATAQKALGQLPSLPEIPPLAPITPGPEYPEIAPLTPITPTPEYSFEIAPLTPITPTPAAKPTPKPTATPGNADWTLNVDDNVTLSVEGFTYHVNLYVSMNKGGGRDVTGMYTGKILYTSTVDEAELERVVEANPETVFDAGYWDYTVEAVSASLDVVKFNAKDYAALWGSAPAKADYMAIGTIDMRIRHQSHVWTHSYRSEGEGGAPETDVTMPVEVCFLITGGQVKAMIGIHPGDEGFSGMLIGTIK